jgi:hypothetical protein
MLIDYCVTQATGLRHWNSSVGRDALATNRMLFLGFVNLSLWVAIAMARELLRCVVSPSFTTRREAIADDRELVSFGRVSIRPSRLRGNRTMKRKDPRFPLGLA